VLVTPALKRLGKHYKSLGIVDDNKA
jgi:hypothetical protein